jgi:chemotaxis protein MotA
MRAIFKNSKKMAMIAGAGLVTATALVALVGYGSFLNIEGLVIVVGGCVANAFLSFQRQDVRRAFDTIKNMLKKTEEAVHHLHLDIMQLIMWSYIVQQKDLIGLEKESAKKSHDALMRYGLDLVLTGYNAENIRQMMHTASEAEFERRCMPVTVLRNMAATAPAFGMVGTLIGMVILLKNAGTDLAGIESGLGVAMLSTLYGIIVARLVCLPAADKLLQKEEKLHFRHYMITEGLAMLAEKKRPFYMQDRLNSFLEPSKHLDLSDYMHTNILRRVAEAA